MAISRAETSAADLALLAADVPCILAAHMIRDWSDAGTLDRELWSDTTPTGSEPDLSTPARPAAYAYDGYAHHGLHTFPTSKNIAWRLRFESSAAGEFDTAVVFGSNLGEASNFHLHIWDSASGFPGITLSEPLFSGDGVRYIDLGCYDTGSSGQNTVYSGVEAVELRVASSSPGIVPRVRELWLGKRIQLPFENNWPYGHLREISGVEEHVTWGGTRTGAAHMRGRAERFLEFDLSESAHRTALRRIWDESNGGTEAMLWIETPSSDPTPFLMRLREPVYDPLLKSGEASRQLRFELVEQNPFVALD